ncbi:MAG TPA: beta-ketoacyl-[acyl-carrier-protein] synthase family protein [Candidatus Binataceae bacterium]|nr:beta-ketoacyl-[acyl-carrier-protein] synthase family protein [Candidatus Binataceae bacterium]
MAVTSNPRRRVAITGIGLVTPLGNDLNSTWSALIAGRSGLSSITNFDACGFPVRIAAEVKDFDPAARISDRKMLKFANRLNQFALAAAEEAILDAGVAPRLETAARWGCIVGAGMMGIGYAELSRLQARFAPAGEFDPRAMIAAGTEAADPVVFCRSQTNAGIALLARRFGIEGYCNSVHTACASGGQAVGAALKLIRRGRADFALAGGFDSMIHPEGVASFCLLGALSADNDSPERASRPFDRTRNGFVLGEGAGFLVLEEMESARRRGARIYAELAGEGNSLSCYRITDSHPSGDGAIQAMRRALADANLEPRGVGYINAHGTSTLMNDRSECAAIKAVFGAAKDRVRVSSTKSMMGHLIAGAGAVEAAICALAIRHATMPMNANLGDDDPECDLNFVRERALAAPIEAALSNSFGFGGSNSCLALRRVAADS